MLPNILLNVVSTLGNEEVVREKSEKIHMGPPEKLLPRAQSLLKTALTLWKQYAPNSFKQYENICKAEENQKL